MGIALGGHPRIHALAGDTDGVDGVAEIAGACIGPDTLERAHALGLKPSDSLNDNDGHGFFGKLGDAVVSGQPLYRVYADFPADLEFARQACAQGSGYRLGTADEVPRVFVEF